MKNNAEIGFPNFLVTEMLMIIVVAHCEGLIKHVSEFAICAKYKFATNFCQELTQNCLIHLGAMLCNVGLC